MGNKIQFRIKKDGGVENDVQGATGQACEDLTRAFEEALGTVDSKTLKPEYYVELDSDQVYVEES